MVLEAGAGTTAHDEVSTATQAEVVLLVTSSHLAVVVVVVSLTSAQVLRCALVHRSTL